MLSLLSVLRGASYMKLSQERRRFFGKIAAFIGGHHVSVAG